MKRCFRGVDTTTNQAIAMLYQDAITLEAEILEIKPRVNTQNMNHSSLIVDIGYLDTKSIIFHLWISISIFEALQ